MRTIIKKNYITMKNTFKHGKLIIVFLKDSSAGNLVLPTYAINYFQISEVVIKCAYYIEKIKHNKPAVLPSTDD